MSTVTAPIVQLTSNTQKSFRFYGLTASNTEKAWKTFTFLTSGTVLNGNPLASVTQDATVPTKFIVKNLTNAAGNNVTITFNGVNGNDAAIQIIQSIQLMPADSDPIVTGAVEVQNA